MAAPDSGQGRGYRTATWLAAVTLFGMSLVAFRRKPAPDPYGEATGRGAPSAPPSAKAKTLGFEPRDMSGREVGWVLFGLGASAAAAIGLMFLMLALLHAGGAGGAARFTPEQRARIDPPAPHLQIRPYAELRNERAREEGLLHSYAWLDTDHVRARIPIERAMELVLGRSLDAGPEAPVAHEAGGPP